MLESDYTYIHLRPEPNGCMDVSLDDETSSMDEIPQKSMSKPQRKTKGTTWESSWTVVLQNIRLSNNVI